MRNQLVVLSLAACLAACSTSPKRDEAAPGTVKPAPAAPAAKKPVDTTVAPAAMNYTIGKISVDAGADVPASFGESLRTHLEAELDAAGRLGHGGASGRTVVLGLSEYQMRGDVARFTSGTFSGTDHITTSVMVKDAAGKVITESKVSSSNTAAGGSADALAKLNAAEIAKLLVGVPLKR